jgi:hypothetical protein
LPAVGSGELVLNQDVRDFLLGESVPCRGQLQVLEDLLRMGGGVHRRVDLVDGALRVDDDRDPLGLRRGLRVCSAVGDADLPGRVAEERKIELKLLRKSVVLGDGVEADSENLDAPVLVLTNAVAEPATLGRSTRGVRFRVEPEDHGLSAEILEAHGASGVV